MQGKNQHWLKISKKVAEKHGVKKFNTKKALQAYKVVEVEATKEAIVNSVVFVVWYLHTKYGWNQKRLVRYITYAHNYLQHIGNETRTVIQLTDEIKSECDFDYQSLMADFKPLTLKTDTVDEDGMKMIIYKNADDTSCGAISVIYAIRLA